MASSVAPSALKAAEAVSEGEASAYTVPVVLNITSTNKHKVDKFR